MREDTLLYVPESQLARQSQRFFPSRSRSVMLPSVTEHATRLERIFSFLSGVGSISIGFGVLL